MLWKYGLIKSQSSYPLLISGGENACLRGLHLCDVVGSLPRPNGVQHVRTDVQDRPVYGPMVSHVRQNLHLHQQVRSKQHMV